MSFNRVRTRLNLIALACLALNCGPVNLRAEGVADSPASKPGDRGPRGANVATAPTHPVPILPALPPPDETAFYALANVPHGTVEVVRYNTTSGVSKQMHVYLPPGYRSEGSKRYPVLYLNHGGGENDAHWSATDIRAGGFAHLILDNLIHAGKARPMIIVMPHTGGLASGVPPVPGQEDACSREFLQDIIPYVDQHYRTKTTREARALAGLSMGGFVVLNTGLTHLETFGELYVFSSGYWPDMLPLFQKNFETLLSDPTLNSRLRMPIYFAAGETDIALYNSMKTLAVFENHGLRNFSVLSSHGHEWLNWRRYLFQTAQIMFPEDL